MTTTTQDSLDRMDLDYYTFNVAGQFMNALMNDDWSDLDDQEPGYLSDFCENLKQALLKDNYPLTGHWSINYSYCEDSDYTDGGLIGDYRKCDITGTDSNTFTLFWVIAEG